MDKKHLDIIIDEINKYRTNLLDISRRNKFLNFHPLKNRTVRIIDENILNLYENLVLKERFMECIPIDDSFDNYDDSLDDEFILPNVFGKTEDENEIQNEYFIQTNDYEDKLEQKLNKLYKDNVLTINEKGFNSLFLALGFLEWTDVKYQNKLFKSPLILIPVNINNDYGKLSIKWNFEEIKYNMALYHVLEDLNIKLPDFDVITSKVDLANYYNGIIESIEKKDDWIVTSDIYLSVFSFKKIAMYQDLNLNNWKNLDNNSIKKLYYPSDFDDENYIKTYDDSYKSHEIFNVLDADSSQLEVIQNVKNNVDLVVEGPPGTGKSQTIVNIIAELMASNKSVLFVSEKKVALDVVKNRLDSIGLGDFCLELHGQNYNKKSFIKSLDQTLSIKDNYNINTVIYNHLDNVKDLLNEYSYLVNKEFGLTGMTTYDLIGLYEQEYDNFLNLSPELSNIKINNVEDITPEKYKFIIDNLDVLSQQYNLIKPVALNYWINYNIKSESLNVYIIENLLNNLINNISLFKDKFIDITSKTGVNITNTPINVVLNKLEILKDGIESEDTVKSMRDIIDLITKYQDLSKNTTKFDSDVNVFEVKYEFNKIMDNIHSIPVKDEVLYSFNFNSDINQLISIHNAIEDLPISNLISDNNLTYKISLFEKYKGMSFIRFINKDYERVRNELRSYYAFSNISDEEIYVDLQNLARYKNDYINIKNNITFSYFEENNLSYGQIIDAYEKLNTCKAILYEFKNCYKLEDMSNSTIQDAIENNIKLNNLQQSIIEKDIEARRYFGDDWNLHNSNVNILKSYLNSYNSFNNEYQNDFFTEETLNYLNVINPYEYEYNLDELSNLHRSINDDYVRLNDLIEINHQKFEVLNFDDLNTLINKYDDAKSNLNTLDNYILFNNYCNEYNNNHINNIIRMIRHDQINSLNIINTFKFNFIRESLNEIFTKTSLNTFNYNIHNKKIDEFKKYDVDVIEENRKRVKNILISQLPDKNFKVDRYSKMGILKKELSKKSKFMPIRKTMSKTNEVLLKIKPCLMMSPLSIAEYLDPIAFESFFDYVIFDEASQLKIEDAIGSLLRGKHYVIMGDTKQLPPTTFFDSELEVSDDEDEIYSTVGIESILDHAKISMNTKMLKWHYRSRHDSLIAVSNKEFYNNKLYVFPSTFKNNEDLGLKLYYDEETVYDKGNSSTNIKEAENIINYLFMLLEKYGESKSIGIATFSIKQRNLIEDLLEQRLLNENKYVEFFNPVNNKFFIKNLENVQGDEKDIILISIGYGFDYNHTLTMNFGPLNRVGGERRLNVLISRAKQLCVVFSNFTASDLKTDNISSLGVKSLKTFLHYAQTGNFPSIVRSDDEYNAMFEQSVYNVLTQKGFSVDKKVGTAGYKIDLAIADKNNPDKYLLAIECDGPSYNLAKSTRDRDRLRQQVLENLGWSFYRIWSVDWFMNRQNAVERLLSFVEDKINENETSFN